MRGLLWLCSPRASRTLRIASAASTHWTTFMTAPHSGQTSISKPMRLRSRAQAMRCSLGVRCVDAPPDVDVDGHVDFDGAEVVVDSPVAAKSGSCTVLRSDSPRSGITRWRIFDRAARKPL